MIYTITVCYCRSAQLARCLLEYHSNIADKHVFVMGHYPIDTERNNHEIRLIIDSYKKRVDYPVEILDPGGDIGSAQSQQWALEQIGVDWEKDYWINLDPDAIAITPLWQHTMKMALESEPNLVVISLMCPMVSTLLAARGQKLYERYGIGVPDAPTPFNLSMFKCSFLKEIGGIRQYFPSWGELEGVIFKEATQGGKYHGYLLDYWEDESNKYFHPKSNEEWKNLHARTQGPTQFLGTYKEFLDYHYPDIANLKI